mmetsp:Transcript_10736/g.25616  ORF Transcript_10736/g.25616 Transcript_10736/m.25616 type:complete len:623 (-) Transcript_10736:88-1956(-)
MRFTLICSAAALRVERSPAAESPVTALRAEFAAVQAQVKQAGRVTPGVYETVRKLLSMVDTIITPAIQESHASDQLLVHVLANEIVACDAMYKGFLEGEKKAAEHALTTVKTEFEGCAGSVESLKARYNKCLDDRDVLVRHNNTICCQEHAICSRHSGYGDCETIKLDQGFHGCDYRTHSGQECFASAKAAMAPLEGYFARQDAAFEKVRFECSKFNAAVRAKIAECAYLAEAVNAKVSEANDAAAEHNAAGRKAAEVCKQRCAEYQSCRKSTEQKYKEVIGPCESTEAYGSGNCVKGREQDRHREWQATQEIGCMLRHYCKGGTFKEEDLESCKTEIATEHLVIEYPPVPELLPCLVTECEECPGCDECLDRPYYQYEQPCYHPQPAAETVCVEEGECPDWCDAAEKKPQPPQPTTSAPTTTLAPTTTVAPTTMATVKETPAPPRFTLPPPQGPPQGPPPSGGGIFTKGRSDYCVQPGGIPGRLHRDESITMQRRAATAFDGPMWEITFGNTMFYEVESATDTPPETKFGRCRHCSALKDSVATVTEGRCDALPVMCTPAPIQKNAFSVPSNTCPRHFCVRDADERVAGDYVEDIKDNGETSGDYLRDGVPRYIRALCTAD